MPARAYGINCMLIYNLHNIQRQRHSPGPDPGAGYIEEIYYSKAINRGVYDCHLFFEYF